MDSSAAVNIQPTIIPADYASKSAAESFPDPLKGHCTWHTLISAPQTPTNDLSCGIAICPPKTGRLCAHRHAQAEVYHILEGSGVVTIDKKDSIVKKGCTVFIPGNAEHGIRNEGDEELKWFYCFATTSFSDIVYRFSHEDES